MEEEHSREKHEQGQEVRGQTRSPVSREKCRLGSKPGVSPLVLLAGYPHGAHLGPAVSLQWPCERHPGWYTAYPQGHLPSKAALGGSLGCYRHLAKGLACVFSFLLAFSLCSQS